MPSKSLDDMHLMESVIFILLLQIYKHFKILNLQYKIWKWSIGDCQIYWAGQSNMSAPLLTSTAWSFVKVGSTFIILAFYFSLSLHQKPARASADNKALSLFKVTEHSDISTLGLKWKAPSNLTGDLLKLYSAQYSCFQLKLSCNKRKVWHFLSFFWSSYGIK